MTDDRPTEGITGDNCDSTMPLTSNANENRQIPETSSSDSSTLPNTDARTAYNLSVRTAERSRILAESISSTFERNLALLQHGTSSISLTSFLIQGLQNQVRPITLPNNSYIISLEDYLMSGMTPHNEPVHSHHVYETTNVAVESQNNNNINNNNNNNAVENIINGDNQISPQMRAMLKLLQQYAIFVAILLTKLLYDHKTGILMFIMLFFMFIYVNDSLKCQIARQHNRNRWILLVILIYITICIAFITYMLELHSLVPYVYPLTTWDMLCYVAMMDFYIKLVTVVFKVLVTCLPVRLLALQNRGKYYLLIEASSQLYRCIASIQPWLYYLLGTYEGLEKIVGILFSVIYVISKGYDLFPRLTFVCNAISKFFQNVSIGVSPSKEQVIASGDICAICHDKYSTPIRLHCKHIFCEICISTWLDKEQSCPLCRTSITDDPIYRDGHTTLFIQLY